jgi:hypothetical protein
VDHNPSLSYENVSDAIRQGVTAGLTF